MLKKLDYDISEKMAKKIDLSEDDIEEDEDEQHSEGVLDDDSYFMYADHANWNRGGTVLMGPKSPNPRS
jgi:hypothetical protein